MKSVADIDDERYHREVDNESMGRAIFGKKPTSRRDKHDYYPTPICATKALLTVENFCGTIGEVSSGDGAISKVLEMYDHEGTVDMVISSDIQDEDWIYGNRDTDFLQDKTKYDSIVTNPPFKLRYEFIEHAIQNRLFEDKMCLLMNSAACFVGVKGYQMWKEYRPQRVYLLSKYLPYWKNEKWNCGGGLFYHAWYVWNTHNDPSVTVFDVVELKDRKGTMVAMELLKKNLLESV